MLAIHGGPKTKTEGYVAWPISTDVERANMQDLIHSGDWSGNKYKKSFEEKFAAYSGVKHCMAVSNGTVSLELILRGFGIGYGDEVILPPYTFVATFSSIVFAGATPVFADIDRGTYNISAASVEEKITPKTKAVVAVAIGGCPPDLDALTDVCNRHGVKLIVDAAQGVGAMWRDKSILAWGDAASVSCQNSKNMTCGEGGIVLTNNDELAAAIRLIMAGGAEDGVYTSVGYDLNMGEFQAAVISAQFEKLDREMYKREKNFQYLLGRLKDLEFIEGVAYDERMTRHACHLMIARLLEDKLAEKGITRAQFIKALSAEGIPVTPGYQPLYTFPCVTTEYTQKMIGAKIDVTPLPECELASYKEGIWFLQTSFLETREGMDQIADALIKVWAEAETLRDL